MSVKPSLCIQHHPSRADLLPPLLEALPGVEVVTDPDPDNPQRSPLRCYLECLRRTPKSATHRVVIQDDVLLCGSFTERLEAAIEERPDALLPLFMPGTSPHSGQVIRARQRGESWAMVIPSWIPTVALVWPVARAAEFLAVEEEKVSTSLRPRIGDDGPVGKWAQRSRVQVWAPVPSLVEHPDVAPSLIGRKALAGRNRARVAAWFDPA